MKDTLMKLVGIKSEAKKENMKKKPAMAIDKNSTFVYQSGADVQKTWRKYGWVPPTEYRTDYEFRKSQTE